ncbi:uncharacterized protein isoform X2 [Takifugu rubripes]|uniref:uncharacterized protein isoform X2 n=1 Tax=Takifugu rubripes TaxID=31033 RepID=UPI001145CE1D|nr:uncharacterized protein LOC101065685 isoform X2 [Takifugu rubripes]
MKEDEEEKLMPNQYSHTVCSYETVGENKFKAAIKLKLSSEEEAKRWLDEFKRSSGFIWRTSKTYPNGGRYNKFRVDYKCKTIKKNATCPATLFLVLKRHPEFGERKSRSGDPHMKEGLFLHINLRNEHNHHLSCAGLVRRDVSGETIEKLKKLFESGHTPSSALKELKHNLQVQEKDNYVNAAADRSVCPDLPFCYRLYYKLFKKAYNAAAGEEVSRELERTLIDYNKEQGDVCAGMCKTSDNQLVIALCTPLMKRVHARVRESAEVMFVDSPGNCSRLNHHLFLLLTHSSVGTLPLGAFITTSATQATFSAAMQLLHTVFPPERFFGHPDGPLVVMTDDSTLLRQALHEAFPKATLLFSVLHLLRAMWRWLWSSPNEIPKHHRSRLLNSFRILLRASTPVALMEAYSRLMEDPVSTQCPNFVLHLQEVFEKRGEWAICLQEQLSAVRNTVNSCEESVTRRIKDKLFYRLKSHNLTQLVKFVVTKMEAHYIHRLTDAANNRLQTAQKTMKGKELDKQTILQEDEDSYTVTSASNTAVSYHVDMSISCCTCPAGVMGGHCKHQSAVSRTFGHAIEDGLLLGLPPEARKLYYQIATGVDMEADGSGRFPAVVVKPAAQAGRTELCTGEVIFVADAADSIVETWCEQTESSLIEPESGELKQRLENVFLDLSKKLDNPEFVYSVTSFVESYESLQTDDQLASALSSFGQRL